MDLLPEAKESMVTKRNNCLKQKEVWSQNGFIAGNQKRSILGTKQIDVIVSYQVQCIKR